jgi:hypothetical protein
LGPLSPAEDPPPDNDVVLIIIGGADDRVCVGFTTSDETGTWDQNFLNAAEPSRGDEPEIRIAGGQKTRLPARWWVHRQVALAALRYFVRHGRPDPSISWEQTGPAWP